MTSLINDRDIAFQLYEMLDTEALLKRTRYGEHSREIFDAILQTARTIADTYFGNHNAKGDANEPHFDTSKAGNNEIVLIPETKAAWDAFAKAGFLAAHQDYDQGGMQLPEVILRAAMSYFSSANVATTGYPFLSIGAANLIREFANEHHKSVFLAPMMDGRFSGTMGLTEPGQGSALADITTYAQPANDGSYRLFGSKMFISAGDHSLTENIVHLVLAKIKGAPAGVKGISLFIVPKFLVNEDGSIGERNDVATAGLLHKMGYRNTTSTVLNFGEKDGAVGYLIGEEHKGLQYMFQMMNEARIGVGLGAAALAYQGYVHSLNYARERPQGRHASNKDPLSKQVMIVEHADVKRMLLAQKAYAEGSLSLCMFASALHEDANTAQTEQERNDAFLLLDLLTPVVKSFPSKYGLKSNELAIQVLGGAGYIREYPVEQLYRDQRLNPIHEGTEGIHGLDLLGRKVPMNNTAGYQLFIQQVKNDCELANQHPQLQTLATRLKNAVTQLNDVTTHLLSQLTQDIDLGLANASLYLDMFGRICVSWIWIKQAIKACENMPKQGERPDDEHFYQGKIQAATYYIDWELPQTTHQATLLQENNRAAVDMQNEWF
jgi:alkylation response protein AidB-like acyl-CoA dehydrogenase